MANLCCPDCGSTRFQSRGISSYTNKEKFRCRNCNRTFQEGSISKSTMTVSMPNEKPCLNCGKITLNPKFCTSSCAAIYNNKFAPKRKAKPRFCKDCGEPVAGRITKCVECKQRDGQIADWNTRTLGEIQNAAIYQASASVRRIARRTYLSAELPRSCNRCGYDKHFEICHIKAINSFPPEATIAMINDLSNLIALCPNCHWEFDHGLLSLSEISTTQPTT